MAKNDFIIAITQLSAEKNLPKEVVLEAVEAALASAFKKEIPGNPNVSVKINATTGDVNVYTLKNIVTEVTDPANELTLEEARRYRATAQVGDVIPFETKPANAGRIAAQTAKQVVMQRLREAEREVVFAEFAGKEGDIVSGIIQRVEPKQIVVDLGKTEAVLPISEQVRTEHYRPGQRLKVYLVEVYRSSRGPQVVVSRTHRNLVRRLFELEVPEIYNGTVEIKAIAREPGYRSKVAVAARQEGVDAVGACVGLRGIRIQNIINELSGEKIDVVEWHPDAAVFVANALSPAPVLQALINEDEKTAVVVVPDRQLSLAIGREGQNARLAAKLTGWRIDIKAASVAEAERAARAAELAAAPPAPEVPEAAEAVAEEPAELEVELVQALEPEPLPAELPEETPAPPLEPAAALEPPAGLEPAVAEAPLPPAEPAEVELPAPEVPEEPLAPAARVETPSYEPAAPAPVAEPQPVAPRAPAPLRFAEDIFGGAPVRSPAAPVVPGGKRAKGKGRGGRDMEEAAASARRRPKRTRDSYEIDVDDDELDEYADLFKDVEDDVPHAPRR